MTAYPEASSAVTLQRSRSLDGREFGPLGRWTAAHVRAGSSSRLRRRVNSGGDADELVVAQGLASRGEPVQLVVAQSVPAAHFERPVVRRVETVGRVVSARGGQEYGCFVVGLACRGYACELAQRLAEGTMVAVFQLQDGKIVRHWDFELGDSAPFDNAVTP